MKKTQIKDLLAGCSLAGNYSLRQVFALFTAFVILLGTVVPAAASEVSQEDVTAVPVDTVAATEAEAVLITAAEAGETQATAETDSEDLLTTLRSGVAEYIETYQLSVDMTTEELANAYFVLDTDGARTAWETLNEYLELSKGLTSEESAAIWADENTKLCRRFYNVMVQINSPAVMADDQSPIGEGLTEGMIRVSTTASTATLAKDKKTLTISFENDSGSCSSTSQTKSISIHNESGADINLSFSWELTNGTCTLGNALSGDYSGALGNGEALSFDLTSPENGTIATIILKNFVAEEAASEFDVTFVCKDNDVTVGKDTIEKSGETVPVPLGGIQITSASDKFYAWINADTNMLISKDKTHTLKPSGEMTVKALYSDAPIFMVGDLANQTEDGGSIIIVSGEDLSYHTVNEGQLFFDDLNAAAEAAVSSTTKKAAVLMNNATLPAGNYTIPSQSTLLIPFDDSRSLYTDKPGTEATYRTPTVYRTLTMAEDANITIYGSISVSGKHSSGGSNGAPSGPQGYINMCANSSITVAADGKLHVWGYITGSGTVTVKRGGAVYEDFQAMDWRGGQASSGMLNNDEKVFPLSQYYVQNVEVPMILEAGATEYIAMSAVVSGLTNRPSFAMIGENAGMFRLTDGYLVKDYDETHDRLNVTVNGNVEISSVSFQMKAGVTLTINSENYVLPLNNMKVTVTAGNHANISQSLALLPGSEIIIESGANVTVAEGSSLYVYDSDDWGGYCGSTNKVFVPVAYSSSTTAAKPVRTSLSDAAVHVAGTLTVLDDSSTQAKAAGLYTTTNNAAITGAEGGKVIITGGTETATHQATQNDRAITYVNIPINSAQLKNRDGSYLSTQNAAAATNYIYDGDTGKWHIDGCTPIVEAKLPTHTDTGSVKSGCECYGESEETIDKVVMLASIGASAADEIILDQKFLLPEELISDANATVTVSKQKKVSGIMDTKTYKLAELTTDSVESGAYIDSSGRYVISRGVASGEMTRDVTVCFRYGNGTVARVRAGNTMADVQDDVARNVRDYAELALTKGTEKQQPLIISLLTYGGYAQESFEVDAENPAYNLLEEKEITIPDIPSISIPEIDNATETTKTQITGAIDGLTVSEKSQAFLDSSISFRLYFTLSEGEKIGDYTFSYLYPVGNKDTDVISLNYGYESAKQRYYLDIPKIPAAYLDYPYKVTFTKGDESVTVQTSVLAYLSRLLASDAASEAQKNLARAMYHYNQAANEYFAR